LDNIWNYEIRPTWWRWWLLSPLDCWLKRVLVFFIFSFLSFLLVFHPFIPIWFSIEINWHVYIILILFLIFILFSPGIQSIKTKEIEVELHSPPPLRPILSPVEMEARIKELKNQKL
jgi:hypothetical protein